MHITTTSIKNYVRHMACHLFRAHDSFFAGKPPISPNGDALFSFANKSGRTAYVQVVGRDKVTGKDFFVKYNPEGTFEYSPAHVGEDSTPFAYPSSFFSDGNLYLPTGDGMRLYISVDKPLVFMVNTTINGPDPHNPSDPNHDILWDKIEFNVSPNAVFTNPTAVDSFSLPLHIEQIEKDGTSQSGGLTTRRSKIFNDIKVAFAGTSFAGLVANGGRVAFAPKDGAATGFFPNDYLVLTGWLYAFKKFYSTEKIVLDMGESFTPYDGGGIWRGMVEDNNIVFIRDEDEKHPKIGAVYIGIPTTISEWIGAAGPSWRAANDLERAMVRNIACAVETNTLVADVPLSASYFDGKRSEFYKFNKNAPSDLQFVDAYSKVLHSYGDHVYTFAYDDELDQSGACSSHPSYFASGVITLGEV
jgi:hypothetical protein